MFSTLAFYRLRKTPCRFSHFIRNKKNYGKINSKQHHDSNQIVKIIAYCLMPTHLHLIMQQLEEEGISRYMNLVLKSYSKYFNTKHKRKGPLWEGRFKSILVEDDEQFLHLTRYIHLNPVSASLVSDPKNWEFSSYKEYTNSAKKRVCDLKGYLNMDPKHYKKFVKDQIGHQRELQRVKHLILE